MEGGGEISHIGEVLLCGDTGGVVVWGGDLVIVGANGAEARGSSCGVSETGGKVEGKNAEGQFLAEVGGRQSASESSDTTAPDLFGQESVESGTMCDLMAYL